MLSSPRHPLGESGLEALRTEVAAGFPNLSQDSDGWIGVNGGPGVARASRPLCWTADC